MDFSSMLENRIKELIDERLKTFNPLDDIAARLGYKRDTGMLTCPKCGRQIKGVGPLACHKKYSKK